MASNFDQLFAEFSKFIVRVIRQGDSYAVPFVERFVTDIANFSLEMYPKISGIIPDVFYAVVETPSETREEDLCYSLGKMVQREYKTYATYLISALQ
jgi:hypothetical protein